MRNGSIITVTPHELVAGGDAIARVDGLPIFIRGIYPGDVARVRITDAKKNFAKAELLELLTPSPDRRQSPCPVADECGGCDWTALRLDRQLEAKRRILSESLRRIGKINDAPPIAIHPSPLNYRLRSRLHVDDEGRPGFFALRSNRVVPLPDSCEVVGPQVIAEIERVRHDAARSRGGDLLTFETPHGLHLERSFARDDEDELQREGDAASPMTIHVDGHRFELSTAAFFQVNRHLLARMLWLVEKHAASTSQRRAAIDLYAGVGFFTLPLARLFERVISVEGSPVSHGFALKNAAAMKNVELVEAAVEWYARRLPRADFIFLDPPRAGAHADVIQAIAERATEKICYLSCDPVTFSRDASRLIASGWRLSTLDLLDLFPNTHHVETLSSFERA